MQTFRLTLPELVAGIPTLMGETPNECVVAIGLDAHGCPSFALTVPRECLLDEDHAPEVAAHLASVFADEVIDTAVVVSYTHSDVRQGCAALDALRFEFEFAVPRVEWLAVSGNSWFAPGCEDRDCCPGSGRPMATVPGDLPVPARRQSSAGPAASSRVLGDREHAAAQWRDALRAGEVPDAAAARRMAASLDDLSVRDWVVLTVIGAREEAAQEALAGCDDGAVGDALAEALQGARRPDADQVSRALAVVARTARAARGARRRAATRTLLAVIKWWEGDLTAASAECEFALASDPTYRLAELVLLAASRGIAPGWVRL